MDSFSNAYVFRMFTAPLLSSWENFWSGLIWCHELVSVGVCDIKNLLKIQAQEFAEDILLIKIRRNRALKFGSKNKFNWKI